MRRSLVLGPLFETAAAAAPAGGNTPAAAAATATPATATPATPAAAAATPVAATPAAPAVPAQAAAGATAQPVTPATPATPAVPDKYVLALPQGGTLDQADADAIAVIAKERQWTNEQAQAALQEMHDSQVAQSSRFLSTLNAHTEVGGAQLEAAQLRATRVLDAFLPADSAEGKELRSVMNKSGYGNYAPLVVLLSRIGKAMGEDRGLGVHTAPVSTAQRSPEQVLYGGS